MTIAVRPFDGPARTREQVERWCRGADTAVLVVEGDGEVVGRGVLLTRAPSAFAGAVPRHVMELDNLVVRADWRSRGDGHCLLEAVAQWSREQGVAHVEVGVHSVNRDGRRFYERFGFFPRSTGWRWRCEGAGRGLHSVIGCRLARRSDPWRRPQSPHLSRRRPPS